MKPKPSPVVAGEPEVWVFMCDYVILNRPSKRGLCLFLRLEPCTTLTYLFSSRTGFDVPNTFVCSPSWHVVFLRNRMIHKFAVHLTRHTRNQRRPRVWPCHFPATGDSESTSSCLSLNSYCDDPAASLIHILLLAAHLGVSLFCIVEWS